MDIGMELAEGTSEAELDDVECCDCGRPTPEAEAEPIEDYRGFGPRLVCPECAKRYE
jgi:hypothetical protein